MPENIAFTKAKQLITSGQASCIVIQNGSIVHLAKGQGVAPLLNLYESQPETLQNAVVVDKVIGKAAAMILVLGRTAKVYGEVMSQSAAEYLAINGVATEYGQLIPRIKNRTQDGLCPIETAILCTEDASQGLALIKQTVAVLLKTKA